MRDRLREYRVFLQAAKGILGDNPIITCGLALPLLVVASVSLKNAVALSLAMLVTVVPLMVLDAFVGEKLPPKAAIVRIPLYTLLASVTLYLMVPLVRRLSPEIFDSLGIYYPLVAVNIAFLLYGNADEKSTPLKALRSGFFHVLGFALAICALSAFREALGAGTLWGLPIEGAEKIPSVLLPFFGFVTLGLFMAGARQVDRLLKIFLLRRESRSVHQ